MRVLDFLWVYFVIGFNTFLMNLYCNRNYVKYVDLIDEFD